MVQMSTSKDMKVFTERCIYLHLCRYSYLAETGDEFEEEGISLTSGGVKITGDVERNELLYGLADEVEEDKRE